MAFEVLMVDQLEEIIRDFERKDGEQFRQGDTEPLQPDSRLGEYFERISRTIL